MTSQCALRLDRAATRPGAHGKWGACLAKQHVLVVCCGLVGPHRALPQALVILDEGIPGMGLQRNLG